jgi:hypothetical protein
VLTGNDLGQLASVVELPEGTVTLDSQAREALKVAAAKGEDAIHSLAKGFIEAGRIEDAWKILCLFKILLIFYRPFRQFLNVFVGPWASEGFI